MTRPRRASLGLLLLAPALLACATAASPPRTAGLASASPSAVATVGSPLRPPTDYFVSTPAPTPEVATSARTGPTPTPGPCVPAPPTVTVALAAGGSLPAGPSSAPTSALAVAFSLSVVNSSQHQVHLVGTDGHVLASVMANNRSPVSGTCGNDFGPSSVWRAMPFISTSLGRVYHLDGDTDVRWLAPDGRSGLATRVPGSSQAVVMFAVSPDDRRIAVSVISYTPALPSDRLYLEDLAGGGNHVELPVPVGEYVWPAGWHAGDLVVGYVDDHPSFGFYAPLPRISALGILDPATGQVLSKLGAGCAVQASLPSPAGTACEDSSGHAGACDWSGSCQVWANGDIFTGGASLSIDGSRIATSGSGAIVHLITSPASGGGDTAMGGGYPGDGGWLDGTHFVLRGGAQQTIIDTATGGGAGLPTDSVLAARLPGGY